MTFANHYTSAIMCTPSRSVLMTGLQTPDNRMFDNTDMPWIQNLSTDIPTVGHMLRKAGYYTAYKGKWHLNKDFDVQEPERLFTREMDAYGFSDFVGPGDLIGHTLGGYEMAGVSSSRKGELAGRDLPGRDLMPVLGKAATAWASLSASSRCTRRAPVFRRSTACR